MGEAALFALGGVLPGDVDVAAVVAGPGGDLVAPPQLAGDAPVMDVLHPVDISLGKALRHKLDGAILHHADGLLGQRRHLHEPLRGDQGLHVVVAAVACSHVVGVVLSLDQVAFSLQVGHDSLAALVAIHTLVLAAVLVDLAIIGDAADDLQMVAQAHLKVIGVMGGSHLHGAGAEADLAVLIAHNGDLAANQRQDAGLADEVLELLILGVDSHAGIAQHGLGAGRGDDDVTGTVGQRVADVPQVTRLVHVLHLGIGQGGQAVGAPVDDAAALVDQALVIQLAECLADGTGAALVHGEAAAVPVAGRAHLFLLLDDAVAVLLLPGPDALQELLAAQVIAGHALLGAQFLLHLDLGGNAGVVRAGEPQGIVALHALEAGQDVLQRTVQCVAHVELAGDIGGRHDDGKRLLIGVGLRLEAAAVHPHLVDAGFHVPRIIHLRQFFHMLSPF